MSRANRTRWFIGGLPVILAACLAGCGDTMARQGWITLYDGKTLALYNPANKVYATSPAPESASPTATAPRPRSWCRARRGSGTGPARTPRL